MLRMPIVQKISNSNDFYIERSLPEKGDIYIKPGDSVEPFTKVGGVRLSYFYERIDPEFTLTRQPDTFIEKGLEMGFQKKSSLVSRKLYAPYDGFIRKTSDGYFFEQDKMPYQLFAGAWGSVVDIVDGKSVLIKGSSIIVYPSDSSTCDAEGELVVFPNPSELLEDPYFNNFTKEIAGKIIYSGYFAKLSNIKKAMNLGVRGIIAGGCDKTSLDYATKNNFFLATLSGFGRIPTPPQIFDTFNTYSNRYIFCRGSRGEIIIPSEKPFDASSAKPKTSLFSEPKNGMIVQVLERPYFGWLGTLQEVSEDKLKVRLHTGGKIVLIKPTNILALDL